MLEQILSTGMFAFLLVFARVGSAAMLLPGFGEAYVPPRIRLVVALVLAFVLTPPVAAVLPPLPDSPWRLLLVLGGEIAVGLFLGTAARLLLVGLQTAGMIVAFQINLANALANDPASAQQGSIAGNLFMAVGVLLIFATDLHHFLLRGLLDSYGTFLPGALPPAGDMADMVTRLVSASFTLAVQIAAPFILVGLIFNLGIGLLARLMPQIQIFFVAMPLQILLGLMVLLLSLSVGMMWFLERFEVTMSSLFGPP